MCFGAKFLSWNSLQPLNNKRLKGIVVYLRRMNIPVTALTRTGARIRTRQENFHTLPERL